MNLDRFIGDEATFPLEHRILNTVLLIGVLISLFTTVSNYLLGLEFLAVVSYVSGLLVGAAYYLSVVKGAYRAALAMGVALAFIAFPVIWFANDGVFGSAPFYVLIIAAMITVSMRSKGWIFSLVGCLTAMTAVLMAVQYYFPQTVTVTASRSTLFADNFIGLAAAFVVITSLYVAILNYYRKEHGRATDYLVRLEKQENALELARLDRLNLIGEMAASIGHEVRNPLTTIRGFLQLFRTKQEYARHRDHFDMMICELDRANSIITEFLSLAKNKAVQLRPCDLNEVLGRIVPLVQAGALEAGKEVVMVPRKIPVVEADEGEIRQLVLNLASNALEAISPGGRVMIGTYRDKDGAVLFVSDTGKGIPPEVLARLGTPFVTTKETGTGLGIPICYRIAEHHNTRVEIDTGEQGTTFRVRFAAAARHDVGAASG
ncbi:MAG: ATP-binding protein [Sporomusaceae bacterium]|nr:ATP-binding protein [Sporomusaceae bacterium]